MKGQGEPSEMESLRPVHRLRQYVLIHVYRQCHADHGKTQLGREFVVAQLLHCESVSDESGIQLVNALLAKALWSTAPNAPCVLGALTRLTTFAWVRFRGLQNRDLNITSGHP